MRYKVSSEAMPEGDLCWLVTEHVLGKPPKIVEKFFGPDAEQHAYDSAMILREEFEQDLYAEFG